MAVYLLHGRLIAGHGYLLEHGALGVVLEGALYLLDLLLEALGNGAMLIERVALFRRQVLLDGLAFEFGQGIIGFAHRAFIDVVLILGGELRGGHAGLGHSRALLHSLLGSKVLGDRRLRFRHPRRVQAFGRQIIDH